MTSKDKLYYLLREYLNEKYDTKTFADEFTLIFGRDTDYDLLSEIEMRLFNELSTVAGRFSPYEEDLKIPKAFFNETQVKMPR